MKRSLALALAAAALSGCGIIYTNYLGPRSWRTSTPSEVKASPNDETVSGKGCAYSVLYLVSWGDAGFAAASRDAMKGKDGILYDVKTDFKATSVLLGLYARG